MHDLARTLDLVRDAAVTGQLGKLGPLIENIERLLHDAPGLTEAEIALIRSKANRNIAILGAAMQGVRSARRRLAELREASTGHRTYGPGGQRSSVATLTPTLRQRI